MGEKTTERRQKDEFVVLEKTTPGIRFKRETNPIRRLWPMHNEVRDLFSWLPERFLSSRKAGNLSLENGREHCREKTALPETQLSWQQAVSRQCCSSA
jgi:hypothetical protein